MKKMFPGYTPRQVLYSTVITNNSKNSRSFLHLASSIGRAFSVSSSASGVHLVTDWKRNCRNEHPEKLVGERESWWWSGLNPHKGALSNASNHATYISSLPQLLLKDLSRQKVQNYYDNTWLMTEVIFSGLQTEAAFYIPPYHNLRHPMIFYYGHPATFYVNKLRVAGLLTHGIDAHFEEIFEVGVDEMRWDDISSETKNWPSLFEVNEYRKEAYKLVSGVISRGFTEVSDVNVNEGSPLWALMMGFEHERIHAETSTVLIRELPLELVARPKFMPALHPSAHGLEPTFFPREKSCYAQNELVPIPASTVALGKKTEAENLVFGWDNEYGNSVRDVAPFEVSKFKVSNGEFLEFVRAGGYRERKHWSDDGWGWRVFRNQKWPAFWVQRGPAGSHEYALRAVFEEIDMPWNWPVCVNYHEAQAFCSWKSENLGLPDDQKLRLVKEAEHHSLRDENFKLPFETEQALLQDLSIASGACEKINNNMMFGSESPVEQFEPNKKGVHDLFGNVWEWSEDVFQPLESFAVHPYYDDFSAPCFDGMHNIILGGSFMSCSDNGGNNFCRYHFRPHFHQHAGFRYVLPVGSQKETIATQIENQGGMSDTYETKKLLDQYLALHFGQQSHNVDLTVKNHVGRPDHALNFPDRCAQLLAKLVHKSNASSASLRALDIGCAVGGSTFALATEFSSVVGIDYSQSFIAAANAIKNSPEETVDFQVTVSGDITRDNIKGLLPPQNIRNKVSFKVADATKIDELQLGKFDAVLCANLLCRLPDPIVFLDKIGNVVNSGGIVLFVSPHSWLEEFTPKEKWLSSGEKLSEERLKEEMVKRNFTLIHEEDIPLIIREHERKYQYIVSNGLAFQLR